MTSHTDYEQLCKEELVNLEKLDHRIDEVKREISRLNQEKKSTSKHSISVPKKTIISSEVSTEDSSFEDEIYFFVVNYRNLKEGFTDDEIKSILPRRKHPRYKDILLRLIVESIKEIKDINEILKQETLSLEDEQLCNSIIKNERNKIDYLKSQLIKKPEELSEEVEEKNNLILVPTLSGNIRIIDELEHIPNDYYDGFRELITSIEEGTFKNVKMFKNHNALVGISEVKLFKIRVVFTRLNANTYALITAFMKKSDNDKLYHESLISRVRDYYTLESKIKECIQDPSFMEENNKSVQQLWNLLSPQDETNNLRKEMQ